MIRKFLLIMLCTTLYGCAEHTPKYVFYLIGDGMGVSQVQLTEMYLDELDGKIGNKNLIFSDFPIRSDATTFSKTHAITCSAASGTALATGVKTANNVIGMDDKCETKLESISDKAKKKGHKIGIITSVTMNHATPAAFYANQPDRDMYYEIALDAIDADYDLYAGAGVKNQISKDGKINLLDNFQEAGYVIARGYDQFNEKMANSDKMLFIQSEEAINPTSLQPAIDRKEGDLTLAQLTEGAINFLSKDNKKGFFLMVEGGIIDWLCHANDAAGTIHETIDFANSVKLAYDFYLKHPKETLIIVTADHETGGLSLGSGSSSLNLKTLENQKSSIISLSIKVKKLRKNKSNNVKWEDISALLKEECGFWSNLEMTEKEQQDLMSCYRESFQSSEAKLKESMYAQVEPIAQLAVEILNKKAKITWSSNNHSASSVPVYAIGVGAEKFSGMMDNALLPQIISEIAGY